MNFLNGLKIGALVLGALFIMTVILPVVLLAILGIVVMHFLSISYLFPEKYALKVAVGFKNFAIRLADMTKGYMDYVETVIQKEIDRNAKDVR